MSYIDCNYPSHIFGVDFSGALNAGRKIWVSKAKITEGKLLFEGCARGKDLPSSGKDRENCLKALVTFISTQDFCAFGLDFPFGIPAEIVQERTWEEFILSFPDEYKSADEFRESCRLRTEGKELQRKTDQEKETPFSPYNLWLYKQTYFGIRDVLHPLVSNGLTYVVPMQKADHRRPWVVGEGHGVRLNY